MSKYVKTHKYDVKDDAYIIDTCVLIYIFFDVNNRKYDNYRNIYAKIASENKKILITLTQIGELINAYQRIEFRSYNKKNKTELKFKEFRQTESFKKVMVDLETIYNYDIKPYMEIIDVDICDEYIDEIFNKGIIADVNDLIYCDMAIKYDCPIITHDFDFKSIDKDITIITSNNRFFQN
ncbi:MAG: PIN domain-containing protein [Clostridia bacterium]